MADAFCIQDPFTPNDYADIILRTSDDHDFHVIKGLLSLVSPIFRDMFSLPQPPRTVEQETASYPPVINITETGPVVDALLRHVYPVDAPTVPSVELAFDVLLAAHKYSMDRALQNTKRAIRELCSNNDSCVYKAFLLSFEHRLEDEIKLAAWKSLRLSLSIPSVHILDAIPGRAVLGLLEYHSKVQGAVTEIFSTITVLPAAAISAINCEQCSSGKKAYLRLRTVSLASWWTDICQKLGNTKFTTVNGPLSNEVFSQSVLPTTCTSCKLRIWNFGVDRFVSMVRAEMEKAASKVEFQIPW